MAAQAESRPTTTLAKIKEWFALASLIVVLAGGIAAGLLGGMKLVIAPLQSDIRAIHGRLDRMDRASRARSWLTVLFRCHRRLVHTSKGATPYRLMPPSRKMVCPVM